ncbi:MAG: LptF/LptG family permease, partial [Paludibacteraceae bacterium]|nr:LptF/LptG family permease [Paludibacteraceae bacterium]
MKRIDLYVLKNFLLLFFATFFICSFVLIMQFLWLYIGEMIGKGLPFRVLLEFLFYSWLALVPMALPLAILLASLMSFGDMGEKLELLAMKSAGVSLFRIMRSLMIFILLICFGAFWFSN